MIHAVRRVQRRRGQLPSGQVGPTTTILPSFTAHICASWQPWWSVGVKVILQ